jgi:quercetin dioxygenase-like cupin family protein
VRSTSRSMLTVVTVSNAYCPRFLVLPLRLVFQTQPRSGCSGAISFSHTRESSFSWTPSRNFSICTQSSTTTIFTEKKFLQTKKLMGNQRMNVWHGLLASALLLSSSGLNVHAQTNSATESSASSTAKPPMHSRIFQWSDMQARPTDIGASRNVFDAPTATLDNLSCHITTLNPGKEPHPAHRHPEEELLVIKEGTLEVTQNGVTNQVSAGGMVFCASNELHGWRNGSTNPVTYYVIHVSPRDLTKAVQAGEQKSSK